MSLLHFIYEMFRMSISLEGIIIFSSKIGNGNEKFDVKSYF